MLRFRDGLSDPSLHSLYLGDNERTSRHHGEDGPDHFLGLLRAEGIPSPQKLQMSLGVVGLFKVGTFCGGGGGSRHLSPIS